MWKLLTAFTADIVDVDDETDDDEEDEDIVAAMYWLSGTGEGNTPAIYTKVLYLRIIKLFVFLLIFLWFKQLLFFFVNK